MKMYNKPSVEFAGIEVEDVIAVSSFGFAGDTDASAAFEQFLAANGLDDSEKSVESVVFEW